MALPEPYNFFIEPLELAGLTYCITGSSVHARRREMALVRGLILTEHPRMERFLGTFSPGAFAVLRIFTGLMFACHGGQKMLGMFGGPHPSPMPHWLVGLGGSIELVGGFLVALGLFGGYAAFLCSGEMAVGYFMAHASKGFFPIVNGGEVAVLYCFIFLYIACHGSGVVSLDWLLGRSAARPAARTDV